MQQRDNKDLPTLLMQISQTADKFIERLSVRQDEDLERIQVLKDLLTEEMLRLTYASSGTSPVPDMGQFTESPSVSI